MTTTNNPTAFFPPDSSIHVIARALLRQGNVFVLARPVKKVYHFMPGGHVENGESSVAALKRELAEELGLHDYSEPRYIGICENMWKFDEDHMQHEINVVFVVDVPEGVTLSSKEAHIEFASFSKNEFDAVTIYPTHLKTALQAWMKSGDAFYETFSQN